MMKKNIFDLYNEQHPIQKADPAELQGVVKAAEAASPVITNEAASSLAAGTVESAADPAQPESAGADQDQESEDIIIKEGGTENEF
jgi:hypothetical protein